MVKQVSGNKNPFTSIMNSIHNNIMIINNNKLFAGIIMIFLNIGSKFVTIKFSRSTEEYLKMTITKQILVFAMAWLGTRDIYYALILTAVFTILSDNLFNEESKFCIVPYKYRVLHKLIDEDSNGEISSEEIQNAKNILEMAKKKQNDEYKRDMILKFNLYKNE